MAGGIALNWQCNVILDIDEDRNVISRTTVQQFTNLKMQADTVKADFNAFNTDIHCRLKEDDFANEGDKPNPKYWSGLMNHNKGFQVEFDRLFNNDNILEAYDTFTPDTYDDNYLNMELEIPRGNDRPE